MFIIALGVAICALVFFFKLNTAKLIDQEMELSGGVCVQNGICLHERYAFTLPTYAGIILAAITISLGLYLIFFARNQQALLSAASTISDMKQQKTTDKFSIIMKALSPEERLAMEKIKEQDGISQTTLVLRTDLSKTKLSMVLAGLEKKNLVKKVQEGKINRIYLKEGF